MFAESFLIRHNDTKKELPHFHAAVLCSLSVYSGCFRRSIRRQSGGLLKAVISYHLLKGCSVSVMPLAIGHDHLSEVELSHGPMAARQYAEKLFIIHIKHLLFHCPCSCSHILCIGLYQALPDLVDLSSIAL